MRDTFLPFSPPLIGEEEINEVVNTLRSGWITTGPKVKRFQEDNPTVWISCITWAPVDFP